MVQKDFKDFFGCIDDNNIKPFFIIFPKMSGCVKCFDETTYICLFWSKMKNCWKHAAMYGVKLAL